MFEENITADMLFNDPHLLAKCLDDITHEVDIPYFHRRGASYIENLDGHREEIISEIYKKEYQLKLLVDFVGTLMDKSQEKMQQQNDLIDKQEMELKEIKDEKRLLEAELNIIKQNFDLLQEKHENMEKAFIELEEKYDLERLTSNEKKLEIDILSTLKDKYAEVKNQERMKTLMNMKLNEEKLTIENKWMHAKEENLKLKEEMGTKEREINYLKKEIERVEKLRIQQDKICKDFGSEREALFQEIDSLKESLNALNEKYQKLEQEMREEMSKEASIRDEVQEDIVDNLNLRMSRVLLPSSQREIRSKSIERDGRASPDISSAEKSSQLFKSLINVEDVGIDQYENIRFSLNTEEPKEFPALRKNSQDIILLDRPDKEGRIYKSSFDSNASTENTLKFDANLSAPLNMSDLHCTSSANKENIHPNRKKVSPPQPKRKGILEEFYSLTWQSALLNSPNFNEVAGRIDPQLLYKELTTLDVPFYQWYNWLGNKFDQLYKEQVTSENRRKVTMTRRN